MWIIPKNLSIYHSAQGMGALTSDLVELSKMLEQSAMWRSKPSLSKTWLIRLKKDCLMQGLFLQTLKPSLGISLVEKWISSQEASLANHLVQQADGKQVKTQDTCGPILKKESNSLTDLPLFSWKMSRASYQQSLQGMSGKTLQAHQFCTMSSENWKEWVTKQRLAYSQRVKSAHHIREKECSYLLSEMTSKKQGLNTLITSLSLINQTDSQHGLPQEVKYNTLMSHLEPQQEPRKLNPRWVEMLMGLPIGWTMPSCIKPVIIEQMSSGCLEMELCQTQLQEPLESFGEKWATPTTVDYKQISMSQKCLKNRINSKKQIMLPAQVHLDYYIKKWATPTTRDHKGYYSLESQKLKKRDLLPDQVYQETIKNNWPTPNARDYKDTLGKVPPSVTKTRGYSLGQALAEEIKSKEA